MNKAFNKRLNLCRKNAQHAVYCFEEIDQTISEDADEDFMLDHIHDNLFLGLSMVSKAQTEIQKLIKGFDQMAHRDE